ncbi:MAG TPA: amino acid adenylation domain-containing protein [Nitrosospira sp.]|nr:amino acid adenylation domain-containing protein [Nitrosospira sp.]
MDNAANIEDIYPLSPLQQGLLFHSLYEPGSGIYVEQLGWALEGTFHADAFEQAWQFAVARHPALRTAFAWEGLEEPVQVVHCNAAPVLDRLDWTHIPIDDHEQRLDEFLELDRQHGFDLSVAPLMRLTLVERVPGRRFFIWSHHHLLLDGWSVPLVLREVFGHYVASCQGQTLDLAPVPPFRNYIQWLSEQDSASAETYWRNLLRGFTAPTPLGSAANRTAAASPHYGARSHFLPETLAESLRAFGRTHRLTLNTLVQGAWALLLSRYSGQADVVWGYTVSGRPPELPGVEEMVGLFINTLPARVAVDRDMPVVEWLRALQDAQMTGRQFQHIPLAKIRGWSEIPSAQPLFESILGFENYPLPEMSAAKEAAVDPGEADFRLYPLRSHSQTNFPLSLIVMPGSPIEIRLLYQGDRFDEAAIDRLAGHFRTLLENLCTSPDSQVIGKLSLLSSEERRQLVAVFAQGEHRPPWDSPAYRRIEDYAAKQPNALALTAATTGAAAGEALTYGELNRRANRLAHYLRKRDIGPDSLVALFTTRTPEMVIAQLAVAKAGGAFLSIDPAYPPARIAFCIEDAGIHMLLAEHALSARLQAMPVGPEKIILIDALPAEVDTQPDHNPPCTVAAKNLAYVVYTSGSTGTPKGVEITHGGLANLADWHISSYAVVPEDRMSQIASQAFDASVWEIWPCLAAGASLHIVDDAMRTSPAALIGWLAEQKITLSFIPTPLVELMFNETWPQQLPLRALLTGGDRLRHAPPPTLPCPLINHYGPTESTVVATFGVVSPSMSQGGQAGLPAIGRPISNTRTYILDENLEPVPIGIAGELYIGGVSLARGYRHRPELTRERFIADPFCNMPSARLYRTGDLACFHEDKTIAFLGRLDNQVKINAHRIELGEIEAIMADHPLVESAAVMAHESAAGKSRLVAYAVPDSRLLKSVPAASENRQVGYWQTLYDQVYRESDTGGHAVFNIAGWNSSYTGLPFSEEEMKEWVEGTVGRIATLKPSRILEIGCGSGMLLYRLAPLCEQYFATDFSAAALALIKRGLGRLDIANVTLSQRVADDFEGLSPGFFDVVILNSVIQYFPSMAYLLRVIEGALGATAAGGTVFIGDIRSLPLLDAFHASVEFANAAPSMPLQRLQQKVRSRVAQEQELAIDPELFQVLAQRLPRISHAETPLRRGRFRNEMTAFRYDALLRLDQLPDNSGSPGRPAQSMDWHDRPLSLGALERMLVDEAPESIEISGITNARTAEAARLHCTLFRDNASGKVGDLRSTLRSQVAESVDPESCWALAEAAAYDCRIRWTPGAADGRFDMLLAQPGIDADFNRQSRSLPSGTVDLTRYCNNPLGLAATQELARQLRAHLLERLPDYMVPAAIVVLPGWPLTPNGKIDHSALPAAEHAERDREQGYRAPLSFREKLLAAIWGEVLGIDRVGLDDNFFELGGDSILSIQIVARASEQGLKITPKQIFEEKTLGRLAEAAGMVTGKAEGRLEEKDVPAGEIPLTPIQAWFFERDLPDAEHFNQALLLELEVPLAPEVLERAIKILAERHDVLRMRFRRRDSGWVPMLAAPDETIAFSVEPSDDLEKRCAAAQASLDLENGPLVRLVLFQGQGTAEPLRLLLVMHHLIVDAVSWRILLEELGTACLQLQSGRPVRLPLPTTSYARWAASLSALAHSPQIGMHLAVFGSIGSARVSSLPHDFEGGRNLEGSAVRVTVSLVPEKTRILTADLPRIWHVPFHDALIAALAQALGGWTGSNVQLMDIEGHGREELDSDVNLSRTVGWFTAICPVLIDIGAPGKPIDRLVQIHEQLSGSPGLPGRTLAFGLLRYLAEADYRQVMAALPRPQVIFNFMGQSRQGSSAGSLWRPAAQPIGPSRSPRQPRSHLIELNAEIIDGALSAEFTYASDCHMPATIASLAARFHAALEALVAECHRAPRAYRPSDFPETGLSQAELDQALAELGVAQVTQESER